MCPCWFVLCLCLQRVLLWLYKKPALLTEVILSRSEKMLVLYRSSGKVQNKMLFSPDTCDSSFILFFVLVLVAVHTVDAKGSWQHELYFDSTVYFM